jgi:hypothetical protein
MHFKLICIKVDVHKTTVSFFQQEAKIFRIQTLSGESKRDVIEVKEARKEMRQCRNT